MSLRLVRRALLLVGLAFLSTVSCGGTSSSGPPEKEAVCTTGEERCDCYPNDTCNGDLSCRSGLCVSLDSGDGDGQETGENGPGDGDGDTGGGPLYETGGTPGDGDGDTGGTPGDGDGDTGGAPSDGGTGGDASGGMGGGNAGTGGTIPGIASETPIPSGTFSLDETGFGTDSETGFQGFAFTYVDRGGSVIYPTDFSMPTEAETTEGKLCASGTAAQVVDGDFAGTWGAGIGWNLNDEPLIQQSYPADLSEYSGVTFTLHSTTSVSMRFAVFSDASAYCATVSDGENTITFMDLNSQCWDGSGDDFDPDTELADSFAWQVGSTAEAAVPFDFCVGGLTFF